jgi:DNA/RNA endonuclease YhcR with UshA esterase domain
MHLRALPFTLALALSLGALTFAEDKPPAAAATPAEKVYEPANLKELKEQVGKPVIVEGTIAAQGENKPGSIRYLNFSKNYKDTISLVFMVSSGGDAFAKEKLAEFVGKKVRVAGTVGTYNEALQIKIEKLDQIKVQP